MIEEDFDIEVRPDLRLIRVTHRCYAEKPFNEHAAKYEDLIACDIEDAVMKALKEADMLMLEAVKRVFKKKAKGNMYRIEFVSKNPRHGKTCKGD